MKPSSPKTQEIHRRSLSAPQRFSREFFCFFWGVVFRWFPIFFLSPPAAKDKIRPQGDARPHRETSRFRNSTCWERSVPGKAARKKKNQAPPNWRYHQYSTPIKRNKRPEEGGKKAQKYKIHGEQRGVPVTTPGFP